jgi:hypothetical protein
VGVITTIGNSDNPIDCYYKGHFADFKEQYDDKYAKTYGKYRTERLEGPRRMLISPYLTPIGFQRS